LYTVSSVISDSILTTANDPVRLIGLRQATYLMDCLAKGQGKQEIIENWGGDEQLVDMWILFLEHNHWIEQGLNGWSITPKGKMWHAKRDNSATS
jgi:hypothetical protein